MRRPSDEDTTARLLSAARVVFVATALVALVTGYIGLREYVSDQRAAEFGHGWLDLVYFDLQLFVLDSAPVDRGGPYPWQLEIARFAAPAATIYALFEAARALFADEVRRLRRRLARGHAVVTGDTSAAHALAADLRAGGHRVDATSAGDLGALRAAGIARARVLYACADDSRDGAANVATALAAAQATRGGRSLRVYAQVSDAALGLALRARRLGLPPADHLRLDFFTVEELAARELLRGEDLDARDDPHIVIAGASTFGRAVLVEYARQWRLRRTSGAERVTVSLVDPAATQVAGDLSARYDAVAEACDLVPTELPLAEFLRSHTGPTPHRAYLCHADEELALRTALTVPGLWHGGPGSVVVRLDRLSPHRAAFHGTGPGLLDDLGGRLRLCGVAELACRPVVINEDLVERLARTIHEHYLVEQIRDGTPMGANPSMTPWEALSEDKRDANRGQAGDIGRKVALIGCGLAPRTGAVPSFAFRAGEIERLAEIEHERWVAEREVAGWVYDAVRDDPAKRHNLLVPWAALPDQEREKDRDTIRTLPTVLAEASLQVVRLDP